MMAIWNTRQSTWVRLTALALVVALSRLPLLGGGYGSDDDSWRNMVAALRMRTLGHYVMSRPPGFPVFESLLALLAPFGWLATNGATALAGVVAALLFYRVAARLGVHAPASLGLGFAFCGGIWITTSQTMDYAYGLALMLAAYLALLDRRHLVGGILLALAAGCRLTHGAQLLGAMTLLLGRHSPARAWGALLGGFIVTLTLVFLPVVRSPELGDVDAQAVYHISHAHLTMHTFVPVVRGALVFMLGRFGFAVVVLAGCVAMFGRLRARSPAGMGGGAKFERGPIVYELAGIGVCVVFWSLIPYENAYLLPALPFALLLGARVLPTTWIMILTAVFMVEPLVTVHLDTGRPAPGRLFLERAQRKADVAETRALAGLEPAEPTIFVVGRFGVQRLVMLAPSLERMGPAWAAFHGPGVALWGRDRHIGYAQVLTPDERDSLLAAGYRILNWPPGKVGAR